jgi:transposase
MEHVGIDLGAKHSNVVVISDGKTRERRRVRTAELPRWLAGREPSRVVMEACTQSPAVAAAALAARHATVVVPGAVVRALGVGARGIKTDDRDAMALAQASVRSEELPSVHLRSAKSRSRRELVAARATLVKARKAIALSVKSWLRGRLVTVRGRANRPAFCELVRSAALEDPEGLPEGTEALLQTFEYLCKQIDALDESIEAIVRQDAVCTQLMQIPGVGPHVSLSFTTHIDEPERFRSADELGSYLALVPGEATTGGHVVRTSTIKAGPGYLKALLVQAAWSMWRTRPNDPMVVWARSIADRRGRRIAIVALARKLATVMWSMWKHGTSYDPLRASSARAAPAEPTTATSPTAVAPRSVAGRTGGIH